MELGGQTKKGRRMGRLTQVIHRIGSMGAALGGVALIFVMLITIASVGYRFFGGVIVGSYELTELVIIVTVGFALIYTTLTESNVAVKILVDRLSRSTQTKLKIFTTILALCFWGWMAWETFFDTINRGMVERTEVFLFSLLPFKMIWVFALAVLTLVLFFNLIGLITGRGRE
ncbi:TRAP transporter small permease [Thermodesulfobacteriota bacterium]